MARTNSITWQVGAFVLCALANFSAAWQSTLTHDPAGSFAPLRGCHASYTFSWSGIVAASGEVRYSRDASGQYQAEAQGRTQGLARAIWKYDMTHHATTDGSSLRPLEMKQIEDDRGKKITTTATFTREGASSLKNDSKRDPRKPPKTKRLGLPDLYDLSAALLYLRSQPLADGNVYRIAVFPATSAYLTTVTVIGREKMRVHAGSFNAIKVDVQLNHVAKNLELEAHRKFKRATVWLSDDQDRVPIRIDAAVFVGTVTAELQSITFDGATATKPTP